MVGLWGKIEPKWDVVVQAFHLLLADSDKTAARLFAGTSIYPLVLAPVLSSKIACQVELLDSFDSFR